MALLTDYLAQESLQRLQDEFAAVLRVPLRICSEEGEPLTDPSPLRPAESDDEDAALDFAPPLLVADVPVQLEGQLLGRIIVAPPVVAPPGEAAPEAPDPTAKRPLAMRLLRLMASVIARRWNRQKLLRTRLAELATLYRLTAEFTGQRELQDVLDLVTRTVVELLGVKACTIRLLNEAKTELVIKAVANLSPEYLNKGPIRLSDSTIDREVVAEGRTVYIPDHQNDPRVLYPAESRREGIVSALCAPLTYRGRCEGVLRVYTAEKREFDWYERSLLQAVAAQAAAAIVNARLYQQATRGANLRRHVSMAAEVQRRMFPDGPPKLAGFDIAAVYVPCFELGGDFYDFLPLGQEQMGVTVCDVVGKGIRASLLTASIRASLRAHAASIYDMSEVLARVNGDLCDVTASGDFATLFYGVIDPKARRLTYTNAGHPSPLLVRDGQCRRLTTGGGMVGITPDFTWDHEVLDLAAGDVLLMFTDGLIEALNFQDEAFGMARTERAALAAVGQGPSAEGIAKHVLWEMRRFAGLQTRFDDLTLLAIKVL